MHQNIHVHVKFKLTVFSGGTDHKSPHGRHKFPSALRRFAQALRPLNLPTVFIVPPIFIQVNAYGNLVTPKKNMIRRVSAVKGDRQAIAMTCIMHGQPQ